MNIDMMIVRLLNLSIDFEELDLLPNIKNEIRPKFKIIRDMLIESNNLMNEIDNSTENKFETSRKIGSFYKRFKLKLIHQTYSLTKKYQRKVVLIPTRQKFRIFFNTFLDVKYMYLNTIDDDDLKYTEEELKILDKFDEIQQMDFYCHNY